ncbi:MAG: hypothetical protein E4H18_04830 [Hyphomicrobiales bacterium]|nr:MAG: hypothetical protein E4H18_04830 [Hyphomicrobiales bacterium]
MRAQGIAALLFAGAAITVVYGVASTVRADEVLVLGEPVEQIEQLDLDALRGADAAVHEYYETDITTTATNTSTTTTDVTIDTRGGVGGNGGSVHGGNVSYGGNALKNFGGVYTSAINTAPGGSATALTSMSITLKP